MTHSAACEIRAATIDDAALLLKLIREFAEHVRLLDAVQATEEDLRRTLFGPARHAEALLAFGGGEPLGFAIFFHHYSTFLGKPGMYLEDLYVRPSDRGRGVGQALLTAVARLAIERHCGRMEWSVLNWNEPAIAFYQKLGARPMSDSTTYRLTGEPLTRLGQSGSSG